MVRQGKWVQFHILEKKSKRTQYDLRRAKIKMDLGWLVGAGLGRWINENCVDDVFTCQKTHWFMNEDDAILFKLRWCDDTWI